jgi:hypothetical protein
MAARVAAAVDGLPEVMVCAWVATPSTLMVTVPVGSDVFTADGVTVTVMGSVEPSEGVVVDGVTTVVVVVLATVMLTGLAVDA